MGDNGNTFGSGASAGGPFGSGAFGAGPTGSGPAADLEALARQYWGAWGDAMRNAVPAAAVPTTQPWQEAMDWWGKLVPGATIGNSQASDVANRFSQQARQWFGQMQEVAARYAGQDAGPADIAQAWKKALGAAGENPFPEMFKAMRGPGQQGLDHWLELSAPYLEAWRREGTSWLGMPAFGQDREHHERLQALALAQADYQRHNAAYNALMMKAAQSAYALFEQKLAERSAPGKQLESGRALFDLWIDAAEDAYAEVALSPDFRKVYGELMNAQMRLRAGVHREVEQVSGLFGMPTRSDVDGAYRKIADLERSVRKLRDMAEAAAADAAEARRVAAAPASRAAQGATGDPAGDAPAARRKPTPPPAKAGKPASQARDRKAPAKGRKR